MKNKILFIAALFLTLSSFGQVRKASFLVPDSTTVFGVSLPANSLIFDYGSNKLWKTTAPASASDDLSAVSKNLIVDPAASGDGNGIYDGGGTVPTNTDVALTDNIDFEGSTDLNLLRINGTNNRIGIGLDNPFSKLQIKSNGNTASTYSLIIRNSDNSFNQLALRDDNFVGIRAGGPTGLSENIRADGSFFIANGGLVVSSGNSGAPPYADILGSLSSGSVVAFHAGANTNTKNLTVLNNEDGEYFTATSSGGVGRIGINTPVPNAAAALEITSTTQGFLPPRMTTGQRDAITATSGLMIYNTTTNKAQIYDGTTWQDLY